MFQRLIIGACLTALAVAPCTAQDSAHPVDAPAQVKVLDGSELPPPVRSDQSEGDRPYFVGPLDTLAIDVFGIDELKEREIQVDTNGEISFPLVGTIKVAGQTPGEIQSLLQRRLSDNYVRNPSVTVNVKEIVSQVVTVEGQVKRPGQFPVTGRMTLLRAIAKAEGTDEFAKLSDTIIFRTVKGQEFAALYNLKAIRRGLYPDPEVFANDVVVVGDSRARRLFKDFLGLTPLLATPLVVLLQR